MFLLPITGMLIYDLNYTMRFRLWMRRGLKCIFFVLNCTLALWQNPRVYSKIDRNGLPVRKEALRMYIAACDDQSQELEHLVDLLQLWQEAHNTPLQYKTFRSATELLSAAEKERFTLYLLDVMMPGVDGMAAAREIRSFDEAAEIVFLTSSPDFAYASYGVRALDYLLKPIQADRFFPVLSRLAQREQTPQEALLLKNSATLIRVPFSQLACVEVMNKHLYYHLTDGTVYEIPGTLKQCEPLLLSRPEFRQIHRSYIVNLLQVVELSPTSAKTSSGRTLPIARGLYPGLQRAYVELLFDRKER